MREIEEKKLFIMNDLDFFGLISFFITMNDILFSLDNLLYSSLFVVLLIIVRLCNL